MSESAEDQEHFDQIEEEHKARLAVIDRVRAAFADVPAAEIEAETDRILQRNRAVRRMDDATSLD